MLLCYWKVFELEEEFDSALDTADTNDDFSIRNQRRLSGASMRRGRALSPPKSTTRARLDSTINRGSESHTFSPLAQVFNPLVVEGDVTREPYVSPGISYGPATRRRPLSIQPSQRRPQPDPLSTPVQSIQLKRFHKTSDKDSPPGHGFMRSPGQDEHAVDHAMTAAEIKDMEDNTNGDLQQSAIMKRLDTMEKRQERIESLLQDLSHNISLITK